MGMKNEFTVTKQEMLSWVKPYCFVGVVNKLLFALYLLLGLVGASLLIIVIPSGGDYLYGVIGFAAVIISVYKLFFERSVFMLRRYNLLAKTYGVRAWQRIIEFTDEDIVLSDHTSVSKFKYDNISKILDKDNTVIIILNNRIALRFYKNTFTAGTWENCKAKIQSKIK